MTTLAITPGAITVWGDRSGKYATLFGPDGRKLVFCDEGSSFNDDEKLWRWAFRTPALPKQGDTFVFATAEETIVGEVGDLADGFGVAQIVDREVPVTRNSSGAPLSIEGTPRPRMTIMIVTMNRRDFLEKTLWHIYETSDDSERDIFIWDNASTDDTAAFLGTMVGWPGVRVFRSKVDLGVAGPRRKMLSAVTTPYIFTLDDDLWMINRGWVSGCVRVLDAHLKIHQLSIQWGYTHSTQNHGNAHRVLARPFFWQPVIPVQDAAPVMNVAEWQASDEMKKFPSGTRVLQYGDETVLVPVGEGRAGMQFPFAASGGCAGWRTEDVRGLSTAPDRHLVCDLREVWGFPLMEKNGTHEGILFRYGAFHTCPGALWHVGHGEIYWADKVRHSEAIYNRSASEQARWLDVSREASGWGQPLEDPDVVLP